MTFTEIFRSIFTRKPINAKDNSQKGNVRKFLSKISGAFMLPISVMAIAGLFLGIGNAIAANSGSNISAIQFGQFVQNLGDPIFGAMPLLFMTAIVISFTDDMGTAVFAGIVGFLVFNGLQTPFISTTTTTIDGIDRGSATILFSIPGEDLQARLFYVIGNNLGIQSLNTSIFGGIVVGGITAWIYNRFYKIELPTVIAFFGGKRFVPFMVILAMIPLVFIFLLIWPWIGIGFSYIGTYSGTVRGLDSFVFGYVERALIPFGLHHVFYSPLWWTAAGGDFATQYGDWTASGNQVVNQINGETIDLTALLTGDGRILQGDQYIWIAASSLPFNNIEYTLAGSTEVMSQPVFYFFDEQLGLNLGRFMQGKYGFMQFALPAAGLAMIMAAPRQNRKQAAAVIIPASLTSFLTGVTEPIEFTFVFLAPALFWGFHSIMAAFSFLAMNLLGAHMGQTFSGGFIDTFLYGVIPMAKGTAWWWAYVIELILSPIYYFVFYYAIKRFNLATPGRGENARLFSKQDFRDKVDKVKSAVKGETKGETQAKSIVEGLGGWENITNTQNCATRLRVDINDKSKVDQAKLKASGGLGVVFVGDKHVQVIMGTVVEQVHNNVKALKAKQGAPKLAEAKPVAK